MSGPIKPEDVVSKKKNIIPEEVFEVINELIAQNWNGYEAKLFQKDIVVKIANKLDINTQHVYEKKYLEIEDIYREAGWKVKYDKPGYNEIYDAFFVFSKQDHLSWNNTFPGR